MADPSVHRRFFSGLFFETAHCTIICEYLNGDLIVLVSFLVFGCNNRSRSHRGEGVQKRICIYKQKYLWYNCVPWYNFSTLAPERHATIGDGKGNRFLSVGRSVTFNILVSVEKVVTEFLISEFFFPKRSRRNFDNTYCS
jgi:hypothetical protein